MRYENVFRKLRLRPENDRRRIICLNWAKPIQRRAYPKHYCPFPGCDFVVCRGCIDCLRSEGHKNSMLIDGVVQMDLEGAHSQVGLCPYHLIPMYTWHFGLDGDSDICVDVDRYQQERRGGGKDPEQEFFEQTPFVYGANLTGILNNSVLPEYEVALGSTKFGIGRTLNFS